jgi:hypothetical protein
MYWSIVALLIILTAIVWSIIDPDSMSGRFLAALAVVIGLMAALFQTTGKTLLFPWRRS